jgi:broad specificity phosphatase PhoE
MKIIIVRHGETEENKVHVLMGHVPGTLSKVGLTQIAKLARTLKDEKIDVIFSSDLDRAAKTTKSIARYHKVPVFYVKELREQNYGVFQGQSLEAVIAAEKSSNMNQISFRPLNGENLMDVRDRVKGFVKDLYTKYKDKTVLLSTHAGVIQCLISIYLGVPMEDAIKMAPKNTEVMAMDVNEKDARLVAF